MDCFKYKIQLSERTKSNFSFKTHSQTTQFKNLSAQASEADYYIVIIHLTGGAGAAKLSVTRAWPRQCWWKICLKLSCENAAGHLARPC